MKMLYFYSRIYRIEIGLYESWKIKILDNKFEMALVNWLKTLNKKKENFCEKFVFEENVCFDILIQEWIMSDLKDW